VISDTADRPRYHLETNAAFSPVAITFEVTVALIS
jgi:hypothetical protein